MVGFLPALCISRKVNVLLDLWVRMLTIMCLWCMKPFTDSSAAVVCARPKEGLESFTGFLGIAESACSKNG